jgi:hypothetical protein
MRTGALNRRSEVAVRIKVVMGDDVYWLVEEC